MNAVQASVAAQRSDIDSRLDKLTQIVSGLVHTVQQQAAPHAAAPEGAGCEGADQTAGSQAMQRQPAAITPPTQGDSCTPMAPKWAEVESDGDDLTVTEVASDEVSPMDLGSNKRTSQGRNPSRSRERRARRRAEPANSRTDSLPLGRDS
jgi:hypothetical protein